MEYHYNFDPQTGEPIHKPTPTGSNNGNKNNDVMFWIIAGVCLLVGAWPVSLIMLILKLADGSKKTGTQSTYKASASSYSNTAAQRRSEKVQNRKVESAVKGMTKTPQYSQKGMKIMRIVGIILTVIGALATLGTLSDLPTYASVLTAISESSPAIGFLASGIGLLIGSKSMTKRSRRFARYIACAGGRGAVSIRELAEAADVSESKTEKDLEIMVEKGLWGEGAYVDLGRGMLFTSHSEAASWYQKKDAAQHVTTTKEAEEGYSGQLRAIRRANDRIPDPVLSQKIDRLEEITGKIFKIIETQPEKKEMASTFLNYYLPTTQKLLDSYADFEEAGVSGENLNQAKVRIEETMDHIIDGFEKQLDKLYQNEAMDIDSDIKVMETMLHRDNGSVADDFGLDGGTAVQEEEVE